MRAVKRIRYFCDHCGRGFGRVDAATRHESGCTANPNRVCGVCREAGVDQPSLPELIEILKGCEAKWRQAEDLWDPVDILPLIGAAESCPACVLSAIRQSGLVIQADYDFRGEMKRFWQQVNDDRRG